MKKYMVVLYITLNSFINLSYCQHVNDSIIRNDINTKFGQLIPKSNSLYSCNEFIDLAVRMCNNDSIVIPRYQEIYFNNNSVNLNSPTYKELLIRDYDFLDLDLFAGDDIIQPSIFCFEEYTISYVQNKYDSLFFEKVKNEADNLDAIGIGYIFSRPKEIEYSIEYFLKKNSDVAKNIFEDTKVLRVLFFDVLADGTISNLKYKAGNIDGYSFNINDDKFEKEVMKLLKNIPKWSPATLRGKAIDSKVKFIINEHLRR